MKFYFNNKWIEYIDFPGIFKDNSLISSIPSYFENIETPMIYYIIPNIF